jgi:hypothetical protein
MTNNMKGKVEVVGQAKGQPLPRRRSYEKVVEDIEKWINSSGLQKPTAVLDPSPISRSADAGSRRRFFARARG